MSSWGFVYCMNNPSMPGIFKIGMTTRSPMQRRQELSDSTSAPMPFDLLCYGEVEDPRQVEMIIHEIFKEERVNAGREFFRASFEEVKTTIREYCLHFFITDEGFHLLDKLLQPEESRGHLRLVGGLEGRP